MDTHVLRSQANDGTSLEAVFSTTAGLRLVSYRRGDVEVIDGSAEPSGMLIGPHYADRNPGIIAPLPAGKWPEGRPDPFAYGVGRYAPWEIKSEPSSLSGTLTGKQEWQGTPISLLEGQQFTMRLHIDLTAQGLEMSLSVVSDADSLVGFEYPLRLPGRTILSADTRESYREQGKPATELDLSLPQEGIYHPFLNPLEGNLTLNTETYRLKIGYRCACEQNSWQITRPLGGSYAALRFLSAKLPSRPSLTVSALKVLLEVCA